MCCEVEGATAALFPGIGNSWHKALETLPSDSLAQSSVLSTLGRASVQYEPLCMLTLKRARQ